MANSPPKIGEGASAASATDPTLSKEDTENITEGIWKWMSQNPPVSTQRATSLGKRVQSKSWHVNLFICLPTQATPTTCNVYNFLPLSPLLRCDSRKSPIRQCPQLFANISIILSIISLANNGPGQNYLRSTSCLTNHLSKCLSALVSQFSPRGWLTRWLRGITLISMSSSPFATVVQKRIMPSWTAPRG